ncbi:MAG: hypothetical protein JKY27_05710 [Magnetovibrio sp.]|nr:hypothetical protein [Magnetovibrio sp.]
MFGGFKGETELWNYETGKLINKFRSQSGAVRGISYSPDGRYFVTGGNNTIATQVSGVLTKLEDLDIVRVWGAQSLEILHRYEFGEWGRRVNGLHYSPNGNLIAVTYGDELLLLDAHSSDVLLREKSNNLLQRLAFSPDGSKLAVSGNKSVWVFSVHEQN